MAKKRPKSKFIHISSVLDKVLNANQVEASGGLERILPMWNHTVGATIAANAQPAALKGQILLVYVANSSWMQQLLFYKDEIITKLDAALGKGAVTEIKFKIGPVT
jgi:predicted nucleic acid-binding Zn ribbon protein